MQIVNAPVTTAPWRESNLLTSAAMESPGLKAPGEHLNLIDGALEMKLVMLSLELGEIIDKVLAGRMQSQKNRNAEIEGLTELANVLRKLQRAKSFNEHDLDELFKVYKPDESYLAKVKPDAMKQWDDSVAASNRELQAVVDTVVQADYYSRKAWATGQWKRVVTDVEGKINFWLRLPNGDTYTRYTMPKEKHRVWLRECWQKRISQRSEYATKYQERLQGRVSVGGALHLFGVLTSSDPAPTSVSDLELISQKISDRTNTLNSTQSLKMLDIQKFTNGRNEAFDLAVKVNNAKFESLNALIRMIGDH
jgi:hypothetical protein